jgi:phospholipid/cholesterol/gamma-HCH transport system substrate-binding protein
MAASKNILIGLFVFAAVGIIIFILLFLHPSIGDYGKILRVRFTDIDKVNLGTRVTFAGKPMGEVVLIRELPEARTSRISEHGDVYVYELVLKVDSGVDVFNTDVITLRTSGLLGERNIEITPRPLKPGHKLKNVENEVLYAAQTTSVEDTMKRIGILSKKFDIVLDDLHHLMGEIEHHEVVAKISKSIDNILDITSALNQPEKWRQTLDNMLTLSERANHSWNSIDTSLQNIYSLTDRANRSWTTIDKTLDNFHDLSLRVQRSWSTVDHAFNDFHTTARNAVAFTEKANQIIDYMRQGKGSLGQLVIGDELYLRLKSILHKGEVVMDDINSYGLLFHLNKRWQRLQGRRLHLLEKLSSPNAFAKYFNQEMDQISASLSRVSLVLNESECYPQPLIYNCRFTQRFAELLKRVENMEETLKIYNEQVIAQDQVPCTTQ